jgi:hypothetical protein
VQSEVDENPDGDGTGRNTQAEASTRKTAAAAAGTARGDAQVKASAVEMAVADVVMIHHEAKIPQQSEL